MEQLSIVPRSPQSRKGDKVGILDPFTIQRGWFVLDCSSFFVHPGSGLASALTGQVQYTVDALQLNGDSLVELRFAVTRDYSQGRVTFAFLEQRYPFVSSELTRQNLVQSILGKIK